MFQLQDLPDPAGVNLLPLKTPDHIQAVLSDDDSHDEVMVINNITPFRGCVIFYATSFTFIDHIDAQQHLYEESAFLIFGLYLGKLILRYGMVI